MTEISQRKNDLMLTYFDKNYQLFFDPYYSYLDAMQQKNFERKDLKYIESITSNTKGLPKEPKIEKMKLHTRVITTYNSFFGFQKIVVGLFSKFYSTPYTLTEN